MTETKNEAFALPEGRLINHSLFVRDQYDDAAKPKYTVEVVFDPDDLIPVEERLAKAAGDKWGAKAVEEYWAGGIVSPIIDGEVLKKRREAKGKTGDAYAGKLVIRAATIFNRHGEEDAGGVAVYGPNAEPIEVVNKGDVYQGCFGIAGVKIGFYQDAKSQQNALMFYLEAFQKTKDGERLISETDHSNLFKPVGREPTAEGEEAPARRRRPG